jgi:ABC-type bacteriocin/lantibiotic exporter with double-glycine peptidase domain
VRKVSFFRKFFYIFPGKNTELIKPMLIFLAASLLETLGVGLVGPFWKATSDPQAVRDQAFISPVLNALDLQSDRQIILFLGFSIIGIFLFKLFFLIAARAYTFSFSFTKKKQLVIKLLDSYLAMPYAFHLKRNTADLTKNIIIETNAFAQQCLIPLLSIGSYSMVILMLLALLASISLPLLLGILELCFLL